MDPASARALTCTSKNQLGRVLEVMLQQYLDDHRGKTQLDTTIEAPAHRCIYPVTRGRCRKSVSSAAIVQKCWKHQPKGGILFYPGDRMVCHWSFHRLLQKKDDTDEDDTDARARTREWLFHAPIQDTRASPST